MIEGPLAKVGIAGFLLAGVWALGLGVDRLGGERITRQGAREGALIPEMPVELPPIPADHPLSHNALVALSIPKVQSIDPGSVRVTTPGLTLEDAQIRPVVEFKKLTHPKPRSIMLLLDNSRSMKDKWDTFPPSDPDYRRLDACRLLLEALSDDTDRVSLACFPCRNTTEDQIHTQSPTHPYELIADAQAPSKVIDLLDKLRNEENGPTPLYRAVSLASKTLARSPSTSQRVMVLLTDGKDSDPFANGPRDAVEAERLAGVESFAIGLGPGTEEAKLRQIAPHFIRADDATALNGAFRQILQQMSREVVQIDLDVMVARTGKPIPSGMPVDITFRSNGKLYTSRGLTKR